jgi:alkylation response protein AidB-like acyl-CoA dehydrogenase
MTDVATTTDSLVGELTAWLESNWDPDLTVGAWWERLGLSGWGMPTLPDNAYGRGLARNEAAVVSRTVAEFGALGSPGGLGALLAAPTIGVHGTQPQIDRYVRDIVTGQKGWCQLFSEPGAGSDLAGLQTKCLRDGDEWVVNGQKVWTSGGQVADLGMLIARTDPDAPKHRGISYFAFEMLQPGVDVRPLREMTGRALFNEVFISDARVPDSARIGDLNDGWKVTNTTLAFERAGLGSGGGGAGATMVLPGTLPGHLDKRAGDFAPTPGVKDRPVTRRGPLGGTVAMLTFIAKANDAVDDPSIRQGLMQLHTLEELGRFNNLRLKAAKEAGRDIPGLPNLSKLAMSEIMRLARDLGLRIAGPYGTVHGYTDEANKALDEALGAAHQGGLTELSLFAQAPSIYGGTDQVQRNIIGERILGLPREPRPDSER